MQRSFASIRSFPPCLMDMDSAGGLPFRRHAGRRQQVSSFAPPAAVQSGWTQRVRDLSLPVRFARARVLLRQGRSAA